VEITGTISAVPDNRIRVRVTKIMFEDAVQSIAGGLHVTLADLVHADGVAGLELPERHCVRHA